METQHPQFAEYGAKFAADTKRFTAAKSRGERLMNNLKNATAGLGQALEGRTVSTQPSEWPTAEEYRATIEELGLADQALAESSRNWQSVDPNRLGA